MELYEITSFSNIMLTLALSLIVLESYELTSFSNPVVAAKNHASSFGVIRINIILKLAVERALLVVVLESYELTSFSNEDAVQTGKIAVLESYELTSFSNPWSSTILLPGFWSHTN